MKVQNVVIRNYSQILLTNPNSNGIHVKPGIYAVSHRRAGEATCHLVRILSEIVLCALRIFKSDFKLAPSNKILAIQSTDPQNQL